MPHAELKYSSDLRIDAVATLVKGRIPQNCCFSFALEYSEGAYTTNFHEVVS